MLEKQEKMSCCIWQNNNGTFKHFASTWNWRYPGHTSLKIPPWPRQTVQLTFKLKLQIIPSYPVSQSVLSEISEWRWKNSFSRLGTGIWILCRQILVAINHKHGLKSSSAFTHVRVVCLSQTSISPCLAKGDTKGRSFLIQTQKCMPVCMLAFYMRVQYCNNKSMDAWKEGGITRGNRMLQCRENFP